MPFENYVNYAGSKTFESRKPLYKQFENYVNYAGSKTFCYFRIEIDLFENYVNYAGSKTFITTGLSANGLRTM